MYLDDLKKVIDTILEEHKLINSNFSNKINLKKKSVKKLYEEGILESFIQSYLGFLNRNVIIFTVKFSQIKTNFILSATSRVKQNNSAYYKIDRYIKQKSENGGTPVNKCFNDLFGCRIVVNNDYELSDILLHINEMYPNLKCIDASKNGYKAIHIYFHNGNFVMPWELQIWLQRDEKNNIKSHESYKQDYVKWEHENYESICI